ncbi:Ig domain-containing protein, partial [Methanobrevibacter sp.]|uniref:Ig-like domain-containing protein n=1 Tax=Methanobrevibacter sp. TaxID=66852 RepID=UPI00388D2610
GEIVALSEGETTITVSFNGNEMYAPAPENKTIEVTVKKIPTEITVEKTKIEMAPIDVVPSGANLTNAPSLLLNYTSSNPSVATVILGEIVALSEGEATITVSFNGTARYAAAENKTIDVIVNKIPTEITVEKTTIEMAPIDVVSSGANLTNAPSLLLNYTSSNPSVAAVILGEIVALSEGETTITVSFNGTTRYAAAPENKTIKVTVKKIPTEITIENATLDLKVLQVVPAGANLTPALDILLNYTSSNSSIVSVVLGEIIPLSEGEATITVSFNGTARYAAAESKTITVNVSLWDASVSVDNQTLDLLINDTYSINATATPIFLPINYTSSDESVATVDANGTVTAVGEGTAIITATVGQGIIFTVNSTNVTVTVHDAAPDIVLTADDVTKYYGAPDKFIATLTDGEGNPISDVNVTISINGQEYQRTTDKAGQASLGINLIAGEYPVVASYNGISVNATVTVLTTIISKDVTKVFRNATQYYAVFLDSEGNYLKKGTFVRFNIHGVMYDREILDDKGLARLNINLNPDTYIITAFNPLTGEQKGYNITVLSRITENKDITKYYRNETQYTAKIIGDDGKAVGAGETVKFNINGVFYERQTDANGIVKLNINLQPGDYVITAEYKECMVSNNIKVLPTLTANDLTKKYGTPDPFVATLVDGQGKPYANQKIGFNINGVFYYRTTESNGQAKLNINLQPGQYIITSSYNDAIIGNTVTVTA